MKVNDTVLLVLTSKLERMYLHSLWLPKCHVDLDRNLIYSYMHVTDNSKFLQPKGMSASHLHFNSLPCNNLEGKR